MEAWESDPDAWKKTEKESVPTWKKLDEDLKVANSWLEYLVKNPGQNYQIRHPDYLIPVLWQPEKPIRLTHPSGAFMYFMKIRDTLRKVKKIGYISENELPNEAPSYLEDFIR